MKENTTVKKEKFTVISNAFLKDKNLSLKSKGLMSVMVSLPPWWDFSILGLSAICKEGIAAVSTSVKELEKFGYIKREIVRSKGRIIGAKYTVNENASEDKVNTVQNKDRENTVQNKNKESSVQCKKNLSEKKLSKEKPFIENQLMENQSKENSTQLNTKELKTDKLNTVLSNTYPILSDPKEQKSGSDKDKNNIQSKTKTDTVRYDEFKQTKHIILNNIGFEALCKNHKPRDIRLIKSIAELMTEIVCTKSATVVIGRTSYQTELVRSRFLSLEAEHIEYVVSCINKNKSEIRNIRKYMLTMLFNSPVTIEGFYAAELA